MQKMEDQGRNVAGATEAQVAATAPPATGEFATQAVKPTATAQAASGDGKITIDDFAKVELRV
jgi:hypothetical protein